VSSKDNLYFGSPSHPLTAHRSPLTVHLPRSPFPVPRSPLPSLPMDLEAINRRIAQFETMVSKGADPTNDMAWFSLGGAYSQAGRFLEAAGAYRTCIELNPAMTKAYALGGQALVDGGKTDEAIALLTKGYVEASQRGDRMPMKTMGELLTKLDQPLPEVATKKIEIPVGTDMIIDRKTGKPGNKLPRQPMRGPLGAWIYNNVSAETWDAWIRQGTKVINELRLDLSREADNETYDKHMWEYLGVDEELLAEIQGTGP
jgi:Fe-S cluster biosynthesis and repair protein YggX